MGTRIKDDIRAAIDVLERARRPTAVRIPNSALAFRPPADVLQVLSQRSVTRKHARNQAEPASLVVLA